MRRWRLSKKDRKRLAARLAKLYPSLQLEPKTDIELVVEDDIKLYLLEGLPWMIEIGDMLVPHLLYLIRRGYRGWLPSITVDQGAVRPISRGADLMRPGITELDSFKAGDVVVVVEPTRKLPLAIHQALYSSGEIIAMEKGRVTRSLHHLGDRYWKLGEKL